MTGWAADRHITPRVIAHLRDHLPDVPRKHRPRIGDAVAVLHALARWARREPNAEHSGCWLADDTVDQIEANTGISNGTIRDVLGALERVGLTVTLSNGGGRGLTARGATRRLVLDPVDGGETPRDRPAEFVPLWIPKLRGPSTETPRANRETPRARPATPRLPRVLRNRAPADAADVSTAPPHDEAAERARATYAAYAEGLRAMGAEPLPPRAYWQSHTADAPDVWADT